MWIGLRSLLAAPIFAGDAEKTRKAKYINVLVLTNIPILAAFILVRTINGEEMFGVGNTVLASIIGVLVVVWNLMRSGRVALAAYLHVSTIWLASTIIAFNSSGAFGSAYASYLVVSLIGGLLLGWQAAAGYAVAGVAASFAMVYAHNIGLINYVPGDAFNSAIEGTVLLAFGVIFLYLIINSFQAAAENERLVSDALRTSNRELSELRDELENRVQERTNELQFVAANSTRRIEQLQLVARLTQELSTIQDINELLPAIARGISERFGYYHAGIFLIDERREYAILTATNSDGGRKMLDRGHRIPVGMRGIVGYAAETGQPRIAENVEADQAFLVNPDLPDTRAEAALPLKFGNRVVGVLDVQSTQADAFSQEEINILSILASQVAISIENARLFTQTRETLANAQRVYNRYIEQQWQQFAERNEIPGYHLSRKGIEPIKASEGGKAKSRIISVPIVIAGQTIGALDIRREKGEDDLTESERSLLEATAQRIALALDNVRLLQEAQVRASKERTIGELGSKIGSALNIDNILDTAAQEIGGLLPGAEVIIQITPEN